MIDAKMPENLPQWMKDHVERYIKSGGTDGHMYTANFPGMKPLTVPSLLLVTKGRKTGAKHLFPLFYGNAGNGWFGIQQRGAYRVTSVASEELLPPWLALILVIGTLLFAWRRESA